MLKDRGSLAINCLSYTESNIYTKEVSTVTRRGNLPRTFRKHRFDFTFRRC